MSPRQPPLTDAERSRAANAAVEQVREAVRSSGGLLFAGDRSDD